MGTKIYRSVAVGLVVAMSAVFARAVEEKVKPGETTSKVATPAAPAADEDIKPSELPRIVTDAIKKKFPKAEIKAAEKGEEDGKPIFEVTINDNHHDIDVTLSTKGDILSFEKTLKMSELPKAMTKSLGAKYPHYSVKLIEEVWENGKHTGYEGTILTADKKKVEVTFDPKGKLIEGKK
jgi:uncharacterized membrane protein YkoI